MTRDPYADRRPPRRPSRTDDELRDAVAAYLDEHPDVSAYAIHQKLGGDKARLLAVVRELRPVAPETPYSANRRRHRERYDAWRGLMGRTLAKS